MDLHGIHFDPKELQAYCQRNAIARLSPFGSILREDFSPASDIDMLVEFQDGARISLFDLGGMAMDLKEMIGREVDLRTPMDLSKYFRDDVMNEARLLYAA